MPYKDYQKAKEYAREYNRKHKAEKTVYSRLWRKRNPEKEKAIGKRYREKHREERNKKIRERLTQRRKEPEFMFRQYKLGAGQRDYKWSLTFEQFMTFWQKPCYYCGSSVGTIGLDRIDNNKGYVIDNITSCCGKCNLMKHILDKKDFVNQCKKIAQFQKACRS